VVFIPKAMLKDNSELFLDNLSVCELEESLNARIIAVSGPAELISEIVNWARDHEPEEE
jgi:NifB/MoaA-like Fe-S oxidoreductase